jgi:hypothetical protein
MAFTAEQAEGRLQTLGRGRTEVVMELAAEGAADLIHGSLILAIGLRESGIRNITGDHGHGRGWLQIDDRFHQAWLAAHSGCKDGTWAPFVHGLKDGGALPPGRVPGMVAAVQYAILLLNGNARFGLANGVRDAHAKPFMLAAYNCGAGNAINAYQQFGIAGIDRFTANKNYSADVLANQEAVRAALRALRWT